MTDYDEEQASELETLRCIYTDQEFTEVTDTPPCFQIQVKHTDDTDDEECSVSVDVQFSYPPTYPDVEPELEIVSETGLSSEQVQEIETYLREQAAENIGMVMIFTLVSEAQDKLVEVVDSMKALREKERKRLEEELKRKEEAKFLGTIVTKESFTEWRERFNKEMLENSKATNKGTAVQSGGKLTGRKLFEQDASLALSDARFLAEGSTAVDVEDKDIEVDESLFQDLEDLDLGNQT